MLLLHICEPSIRLSQKQHDTTNRIQKKIPRIIPVPPRSSPSHIPRHFHELNRAYVPCAPVEQTRNASPASQPASPIIHIRTDTHTAKRPCPVPCLVLLWLSCLTFMNLANPCASREPAAISCSISARILPCPCGCQIRDGRVTGAMSSTILGKSTSTRYVIPQPQQHLVDILDGEVYMYSGSEFQDPSTQSPRLKLCPSRYSWILSISSLQNMNSK
ncbi:hypothetical protein HDV57DRAFT_199628 [Trichoderma longibrachiatum]